MAAEARNSPAHHDEDLDAEVVATLRLLAAETGPDLLPELAHLFQDEAARHLATMGDALSTGDAASLAKAAHALKGSAATVGARQVAAGCARLERLARAGDMSGTDGLVATLVPQLRRFDRAFAAALEAAPDEGS